MPRRQRDCLLYHILTRYRVGHDRLLEQATEEHAARTRGAAIEAKRELVETGVQVLRLETGVLAPASSARAGRRAMQLFDVS